MSAVECYDYLYEKENSFRLTSEGLTASNGFVTDHPASLSFRRKGIRPIRNGLRTSSSQSAICFGSAYSSLAQR